MKNDRQIVLAAHLKPLEKKDSLHSLQPWDHRWNPRSKESGDSLPLGAHGTADSTKPVTSTSDSTPTCAQNEVPTTLKGFRQCWHQLSEQQARFDFLTAYTTPSPSGEPDLLNRIFKVEIESALLSEITQCFFAILSNPASPSSALTESISATDSVADPPCGLYSLSRHPPTEQGDPLSKLHYNNSHNHSGAHSTCQDPPHQTYDWLHVSEGEGRN